MVMFAPKLLALTVDDVLNSKSEPSGIVFEIVSGNADLLRDLLPVIRNNINRLRSRFPKLPVAIVTHGSEQFSLTNKNRKMEKKIHTMVKEMVINEDIDFHVCGTYAQWYGVSPEDFPDYVDVAVTGPAQINDYEELGYVVITLP